MINDLIKLANHFDKSGLYKEANFLDRIIKKFSDKSRILPITVGDVGLENEELDNVNLDAEEKFKLVYKDTAKNEVLSRPCKSWEETKKEYNKINTRAYSDIYTDIKIISCLDNTEHTG